MQYLMTFYIYMKYYHKRHCIVIVLGCILIDSSCRQTHLYHTKAMTIQGIEIQFKAILPRTQHTIHPSKHADCLSCLVVAWHGMKFTHVLRITLLEFGKACDCLNGRAMYWYSGRKSFQPMVAQFPIKAVLIYFCSWNFCCREKVDVCILWNANKK